jgi:hypothetical protein
MNAIHKHLTDGKNPKTELNFHFIDGENIVTTNTRILLVEKHNLKVEENKLIFPDKTGKCISSLEYRPEVELFHGKRAINESLVGKYPEYKRIIPDGMNNQMDVSVDNLLETVYLIVSKHDIVLDFVTYSSLFKELRKIPVGEKEVVKYNYNSFRDPLTIKTETLTLVIMPLILKAN